MLEFVKRNRPNFLLVQKDSCILLLLASLLQVEDVRIILIEVCRELKHALLLGGFRTIQFLYVPSPVNLRDQAPCAGRTCPLLSFQQIFQTLETTTTGSKMQNSTDFGDEKISDH